MGCGLFRMPWIVYIRWVMDCSACLDHALIIPSYLTISPNGSHDSLRDGLCFVVNDHRHGWDRWYRGTGRYGPRLPSPWPQRPRWRSPAFRAPKALMASMVVLTTLHPTYKGATRWWGWGAEDAIPVRKSHSPSVLVHHRPPVACRLLACTTQQQNGRLDRRQAGHSLLVKSKAPQRTTWESLTTSRSVRVTSWSRHGDVHSLCDTFMSRVCFCASLFSCAGEAVGIP